MIPREKKKITATNGIHSVGYVLWILGSVGQNMLTLIYFMLISNDVH